MANRWRGHAVVDILQRQHGELSARKFTDRRRASEDLVLRLRMYRKLQKHNGCVNTVNFNSDGSILISGSDDRKVILWDWQIGKMSLAFHSGHRSNVFQARFMPYSDDRSIVTCAADGQIKHAQILERGEVETVVLAEHEYAAHKLAIEPGSPHVFYSSAEDGVVQRFDLRTKIATKLFTCQFTEESGHIQIVRLNDISIDPNNPTVIAVAGSDEYARLYDVRKCRQNGSTERGQPTNHFCPPDLLGCVDDENGVTSLTFSDHSELLVSYIGDHIYLFTSDMGLGPDLAPTLSSSSCGMTPSSSDASLGSSTSRDIGEAGPQVYKGHMNFKTVKGVGFFGPKCEYVVSGSDCGHIFIWRKKDGELIRVIEADRRVVNCVESHPQITALASSGIEHNVKIWTPMASEKASLPRNLSEDQLDRIDWDLLDEYEYHGWQAREDLLLAHDDDDDEDEDEDEDDDEDDSDSSEDDNPDDDVDSYDDSESNDDGTDNDCNSYGDAGENDDDSLSSDVNNSGND